MTTLHLLCRLPFGGDWWGGIAIDWVTQRSRFWLPRLNVQSGPSKVLHQGLRGDHTLKRSWVGPKFLMWEPPQATLDLNAVSTLMGPTGGTMSLSRHLTDLLLCSRIQLLGSTCPPANPTQAASSGLLLTSLLGVRMRHSLDLCAAWTVHQSSLALADLPCPHRQMTTSWIGQIPHATGCFPKPALTSWARGCFEQPWR